MNLLDIYLRKIVLIERKSGMPVPSNVMPNGLIFEYWIDSIKSVEKLGYICEYSARGNIKHQSEGERN